MVGVLVWLAIDARRRWRSLLGLFLLLTFSGAVVLTSLAGAHRGHTALERLRADTLPVDALAVANIPGLDWTRIDALPYVVAHTHFVLGAAPRFEETVQHPGMDDNVDFLRDDTAWMRTIERPVVIRGRMLDPNRPDEAVVAGDYQAIFGYDVGDTLHLHLPSPQQADTGSTDEMSADDYKGPEIDVHIVGEVKSPWFVTSGPQNAGLVLSPTLMADYRANILGATGHGGWENDGFRLQHGEADIPRLRQDIARITGRSIDVWDYQASYDTYQSIDDHDAGFLAAFGLAALVAAVVLVGQAIGRYAASSTTELETARALGMSPSQVTLASSLNLAAVALLSGAASVGIAIYASRWFPVGYAAGVEPAPGVGVDWLVLPLGFLGIVGFATAAAVFSSRSAGGRADRKPTASRLATAAAAANAPVPVVAGIRFALETGSGRNAVPVRPALIASLVGVLGVISVSVLWYGVTDAASHPERFGQTYQAAGFLGYNGHDILPTGGLADTLAALPEVTAVNDSLTQVADLPHGRGSIQLYDWNPGAKPLATTVLSGRMPMAPDEVALGPSTLKADHLQVGDTVTLASGSRTRRLSIVGSVFTPTGPHNDYAEGGWIPDAGYHALFTDFKFHLIHVALAPAYRNDGGMAQLNKDLLARLPALRRAVAGMCGGSSDPSCGQAITGLTDLDITTNGTVQVLRGNQRLPLYLAAFLLVLAVGAIAHALATAVRRRSVDLAVLRAVGLTPGQSRWIVVVQACVLALFGLAFGVPLGVALGRTAWRWIAAFTPVQYLPPDPVLILLLVVPVALVVVNLLAALPARRAGRTQVATVLRAE